MNGYEDAVTDALNAGGDVHDLCNGDLRALRPVQRLIPARLLWVAAP